MLCNLTLQHWLFPSAFFCFFLTLYSFANSFDSSIYFFVVFRGRHAYANTRTVWWTTRYGLSFIYSLIHSFVHLFVHSFVHSFSHQSILSFIHPSVDCSFVHSFVHSFINLFFFSLYFQTVAGFPVPDVGPPYAGYGGPPQPMVPPPGPPQTFPQQSLSFQV